LGLAGKRARFNPLPGLTAERLSRALDDFGAGHLRAAVNVWEHLEERDDLLRGVISKRKKAVARHGWTVTPLEGLSAGEQAEAARQVAVLEFFYRNLECEHAVDTNERGGFRLLARQMMDAVGKRFAVHEIVWVFADGHHADGVLADGHDFGGRLGNGCGEREASVGVEPGPGLTARFRFVPLGFFENTTGELRFLREEWTMTGEKLSPGGWMVTVGEGLMAASAVAWLFKQMSLNDWLEYCEHQGKPGVQGVTSAARDSEDWKALEKAVADLALGKPVVTSNEPIRVVNWSSGAETPFPQLVERMDRMMAALWRGADLSTLSRDRGYGASLQAKEGCVLEEDDAEMLTETLRRQVDRWVIRHAFGEKARPLAGVKVLVSPKECTADDLRVDEFLLGHGAPLGLESTMARYGRTPARRGELVLRSAEAPKRGDGTGQDALGKDCEGGCAMGHEAAGPGSAKLAGSAFFGAGEGHLMSDQEVVPLAAPACGLGLGNGFEVLQPEWVQLSPYGEFPHARGLQRVDREAATGMVRQFESFAARLGRLFGGLPFYVGHPDMVAGEGIDRKAYGWVEGLEAREAGLFGRVKWSEAGLELLRQGHFKFLSPYWEAREIGREKGQRVYRPVALISVGLTNQPNLPVAPLANAGGTRSEGLAAAEDASAPASAEATEAAAACETAVAVAQAASAAGLENGVENGEFNITPLLREITVNEALGNALREGRITPAERGDWQARLRQDFVAGIEALRARPLAMHAESVTLGLGRRKGEMARSARRRERIQAYVREKTQAGLSYDEAWETVKRERGALFAEEAA